jgi:Amt family ammonium transporter
MPDDHYLTWIFESIFASSAATIVSGALAERCQLTTYVVFSFLMTSFIYPVVCAWDWGGGWLEQGGLHDFAGTTTIHLVGGTAAVCGAYILGERIGKAEARKKREEER